MFLFRSNRERDRLLSELQRKVRMLMFDFTQLANDVAKNTDLVASASQTLSGLSASLADAIARLQAANPSGDFTALTALQTQIEANNATLSASIAANTQAPAGATGAPAAPAPAADPNPPTTA